MELPTSARELIESGAEAHLVTLNDDGGPQLSMVWATVEDEQICVASLTDRRKLGNVRRDPRVALSFAAAAKDALGMRYYLVVYGRAIVTAGEAPELLAAIKDRFLLPGTKFPRGDAPHPGYVMRITPERIAGYGPWAGNG
jgi:PPOX class probable F420-dependent enzyme